MTHSTQLAPVTALQQLIQENPDLPRATWTIDPHEGVLHGHLHGVGMLELSAYMAVLGGAVRCARDFEHGGRTVRPHYLTSTWRDVSVSVVVLLPAPVESAVAA
ncbi:hypothetical protein ACFWCB_26190 [Streptomyces sp. NPDC060048]|uniref:hypothetical protein n=1 Tax=unclassified Streptomyces TaxID=2593676 RepID=UPI0036AB39DE